MSEPTLEYKVKALSSNVEKAHQRIAELERIVDALVLSEVGCRGPIERRIYDASRDQLEDRANTLKETLSKSVPVQHLIASPRLMTPHEIHDHSKSWAKRWAAHIFPNSENRSQDIEYLTSAIQDAINHLPIILEQKKNR